MRKQARAVSQHLFLLDGIDQGEMEGFTLRRLLVVRLDQRLWKETLPSCFWRYSVPFGLTKYNKILYR